MVISPELTPSEELVIGYSQITLREVVATNDEAEVEPVVEFGFRRWVVPAIEYCGEELEAVPLRKGDQVADVRVPVGWIEVRPGFLVPLLQVSGRDVHLGGRSIPRLEDVLVAEEPRVVGTAVTFGNFREEFNDFLRQQAVYPPCMYFFARDPEDAEYPLVQPQEVALFSGVPTEIKPVVLADLGVFGDLVPITILFKKICRGDGSAVACELVGVRRFVLAPSAAEPSPTAVGAPARGDFAA